MLVHFRWCAGKLAPKKYGDRVEHEIKGGVNFQPQILIQLHPKQLVPFRSKATEILYRGAAGGGNPHLMRAAAMSGCSVIAGLQVYLFRPIASAARPPRAGCYASTWLAMCDADLVGG